MPVCAICGKDVVKVTDDHIPAKGLFAVKPNNLITVPACEGCNRGRSKDDEYFRLLAVEIGTAEHPEARKLEERIVRSLERPQARGFREGLRQAVIPLQVEEDGKTEIKPFVGLDVRRLDQIAAQYARGLFYHVRGYPVPANYKVLAANLDLFMAKPNSIELAKLVYNYVLPKLSWIKPTVIGNDVFSYRVFSEDDDPNTMFILMEFFVRWRYFGIVMESRS